MLLPCRWIRITEMFDVSRGGALCVFRSCHRTKQMVTTSPSMFLNRITCLDEPSGEKKNTSQNMDLHALQSHVHYAKSSADKQTRTVQVRHLSLKQN